MSVFVRCAQTFPFGAQERRSSRLEAVLRAGQAHLAATTVPTGAPPPLHPPMKVTDLPNELAQIVTNKLAVSNAGKATSVCKDLNAWCRTHPVACRDNDDMWRVAFEALYIYPPGPAPPTPPPMPPKPKGSDFGLTDPLPKPPGEDLGFQLDDYYGADSPADSESDSDDNGPSLPLPGGADTPPLTDEEKAASWEREEEVRRRYEAFMEAMDGWLNTKQEHDRATAKVQRHAAEVAAVAAKRAALAANPPASYRDAFTNVCTRIDQVRNGDFRAIRHVHPALLRSETFMQNVAAVDARVIYYGIGFNREDDESMWKSAIIANPSNLEHATIYRYDNPGDISEEDVKDILDDGHPEILPHMPGDYDLDVVDWDLQGRLEDNPLLLEYMSEWFNDYEDECLMLKLAKKDGRSLQFMSETWRSDKRIVLAALEQASETGADVYKHVMGTSLRRDPDVRIAAGLRPWPGQRRVRRNREEEAPCTDDSESEGEEEPEEYDPNQSPFSGGEPPMLPADYMPGAARTSPARVEPAPSLRRIEREMAEYDATSSDEEDPESPTSTFDVKLKARNKDDSSSEEEDVSHGMDAGNVMMDDDEGEEGGTSSRSPVKGDYKDYDNERAFDRNVANMRAKRSW